MEEQKEEKEEKKKGSKEGKNGNSNSSSLSDSEFPSRSLILINFVYLDKVKSI